MSKIALTGKDVPKRNGSVWIVGNMAVTDFQLTKMGYSYDHIENLWYKETGKKD